HPDIMVFCLVLDEVLVKEKLFVVDITKNISTILRLKSAIKKEKEPDLDHFASNTLKILDNVFCTVDIKQDLGGIKLFLANGIPKNFYKQQPPLVKIIHIIIQVPATDGLGGTMLSYFTDHKTFKDISFNNSYISYKSKVVFSLVKDLIKKKIILVREPPYSGKTSLAQLMEYYLINSSEYYSRQCQQVLSILVLDKGCLQEITNIYIIAYGYYSANSARLSTPVEILPSKCKSLLDIVFNYEELKEYNWNANIRENRFLSCDMDAVFGYDGYIDFYIDGIDWAIKLLRDSKHMAEHSNRFEPTGEYKKIAKYTKSVAIIDI
ncbi:15004_t:CDS:2, partial [Gigaspora margarita]